MREATRCPLPPTGLSPPTSRPHGVIGPATPASLCLAFTNPWVRATALGCGGMLLASGNGRRATQQHRRVRRLSPSTAARRDRRLAPDQPVLRGHGRATVLSDAGAGESMMVWRHVQGQIAQVTRACSYDRAGYGFSDSATRASMHGTRSTICTACCARRAPSRRSSTLGTRPQGYRGRCWWPRIRRMSRASYSSIRRMCIRSSG